MRGKYELEGGYFLHTGLDKPAKRGRIKSLVKQVGLGDVEFLGEWESD